MFICSIPSRCRSTSNWGWTIERLFTSLANLRYIFFPYACLSSPLFFIVLCSWRAHKRTLNSTKETYLLCVLWKYSRVPLQSHWTVFVQSARHAVRDRNDMQTTSVCLSLQYKSTLMRFNPPCPRRPTWNIGVYVRDGYHREPIKCPTNGSQLSRSRGQTVTWVTVNVSGQYRLLLHGTVLRQQRLSKSRFWPWSDERMKSHVCKSINGTICFDKSIIFTACKTDIRVLKCPWFRAAKPVGEEWTWNCLFVSRCRLLVVGMVITSRATSVRITKEGCAINSWHFLAPPCNTYSYAFSANWWAIALDSCCEWSLNQWCSLQGEIVLKRSQLPLPVRTALMGRRPI